MLAGFGITLLLALVPLPSRAAPRAHHVVDGRIEDWVGTPSMVVRGVVATGHLQKARFRPRPVGVPPPGTRQVRRAQGVWEVDAVTHGHGGERFGTERTGPGVGTMAIFPYIDVGRARTEGEPLKQANEFDVTLTSWTVTPRLVRVLAMTAAIS